MSTLHFPHAWGVTSATSTLATSGSADEVFPFASVTKPIAAYAMLVAVERGYCALEDPCGPEGSTLRHLLAHASGIRFDDDGALAPVGQRRIYSNRGIEVAADHVAEATGVPFEQWVEESVLVPLGMASTFIEGSPAHSGRGSVNDLLAFGREILQPTLVGEGLANELAAVQFPGLAGLLPGYARQEDNTWGLGFEIRGKKSPHWLDSSFPAETFGHFGQSGSFLWVDRSIWRAGAFLGARDFSAEHKAAWPELTREMRELG